jgi:hypothetical protein
MPPGRRQETIRNALGGRWIKPILLSLAAQKQLPRQHLAKPGFDLRTKWERLATILLPNSVAAHDTRRDVVDGPAKILKENNTPRNVPSPAGMAANALRMRCSTARFPDPFRRTLP